MHELSIAMGIVRIAENEIAKVNAQKVEQIELEIGTLAGIEIDALDFVWSICNKRHRFRKCHKDKLPL